MAEALTFNVDNGWGPFYGAPGQEPWATFRLIPGDVDQEKPTVWWQGDLPPDAVTVRLKLASREGTLVTTGVLVESPTGEPLTSLDLRRSVDRYLRMLQEAIALEQDTETWRAVMHAVGVVPDSGTRRKIGGSAAGRYQIPREQLEALAEDWVMVRAAKPNRTQAIKHFAERFADDDGKPMSRKAIYTRLERCVELRLLTEEEAAR